MTLKLAKLASFRPSKRGGHLTATSIRATENLASFAVLSKILLECCQSGRFNAVNMSDPPKVFISHASEDKARFVLRFGELLRSKGVEAWVDKWEMRPGDSIVGKIFEEGLKNASAVIVILSEHSVAKPWVREELNTAMVRKINGLTKLIPVVIDECEVPECLRSTLWERISNLDNYEEGLNRILHSIFGVIEKPPLGQPPKYTEEKALGLPGVKTVDAAVFAALCRSCLSKDVDWVDGNVLTAIPKEMELDEKLFCESLHILESQSFVELRKIDSGYIWLAKPTVYGFHKFLIYSRQDYGRIVKIVAALILNEKKLAGNEIAAAAKLQDASLTELIVNFIVLYFERNGWVYAARFAGPSPCSFKVTKVMPQFERWLRDIDSQL